MTVFFALLLAFTPSWAQAGGGGGSNGSSTSNSCPPFSTAAPVAETVPGYSSAAPAQLYPDPVIGNDKLNNAIPDAVQNAWYDGMPAPGVCGDGGFGLCITDDFSKVQGTRVAALTASTTNVIFGAPKPIQATVDAVTSQESNNCGQTATKWSWVVTPSAVSQTAYFPTDTQVQVSYSCQPNQTYEWQTHTSCFLGIGNCNVKYHARMFLFATQAQATNIPAVSSLYGKTTFTPEAGSTYTLQCGGYRPENGSAEPPSYSVVDQNHGVCFFGIDCSGGSDGATYNVADASYWQPGITLSVNVCDDPDDIVVDNVCTPCSTVKPGSHRLDNVCVMSTPTLTIDAIANGTSVSSVPVGTKVTIQATYVNDKSDPLTKTDITGGAGSSTSSICGSGKCSTVYNSQKSAATSTYTFTPSATGTYTFYPQAQTQTLNVLQNYGNLSKTLTVTAPCPANAKQSGNTCVCTQQYFAYIGNACVLTCPATMQSNQAGNSCIAKLPSADSITFSAERVRSGQSAKLSWSIPSMIAGIACDITPHAGLTTQMPAWSSGSPWTGFVTTIELTQPATYTLSCSNGENTVSKDVTVQIVPQYQEI
ncbi:MAG TPA: hypothetical protein VG934_02120 [Candidatus Paceibacterota bacterium]|nr:hypothetical protein [Candidatus Paceibacterota bacterium]